jgi:hypothetical protein
VAGVKEAGRFLLVIGVFNNQGERLCTLHTQTTANLSFAVSPGKRVRVACNISSVNLLPGTFKVSAALKSAAHKQRNVEGIDRAFEFEVVAKDVFHTGRMSNMSGVFYWPCHWDVEPVSTAEAF